MLFDLPEELLLHVILQYVSQESLELLPFRLVCRHWNTLLTAPHVRRRCSLTLSQDALVKLASSSRLTKEGDTLSSGVWPFGGKRFPGHLQIETHTGLFSMRMGTSQTALNVLAQILRDVTECQTFEWHDHALARVARHLATDLQKVHTDATTQPDRRDAVSACPSDRHPAVETCPPCVSSPRPHGERDSLEHKTGCRTLRKKQHPLSPLIRHVTSCTNAAASCYMFPSLVDRQPQHNFPIIFPRPSHSVQRETAPCSCGSLFLLKALHAAWDTLHNVLLPASSPSLRRLSLRGLIFDVCHWLFQQQQQQQQRHPRIHFPNLRSLDCSMALMPLFVSCPSLQRLTAYGSVTFIDAVVQTLQTASQSLRVLSVNVRSQDDRVVLCPNSDPEEQRLSCDWSQRRQSGGAPQGDQKKKKVDAAAPCAAVTTFCLTWAAGAEALATFLDRLTFPYLTYLHIEEVSLGGGAMQPPSVAQRLTTSLAAFLERSGGMTGTLQYVGLELKSLDDALQSNTTDKAGQPLPVRFTTALSGLRILKSSAVVLTTLLTHPTHCPHLTLWHCWRITSARGLDRDATVLRVWKALLAAIKTSPSLRRVCLPATIGGTIHIDAITHLRLVADSRGVIQPLRLCQASPTLVDLSIYGQCDMASIEPLVASVAQSITTLTIHGLQGRQEVFAERVGALCPSLQALSVSSRATFHQPSSPCGFNRSSFPANDDACIQEYWQHCYNGYQLRIPLSRPHVTVSSLPDAGQRR